MVRSGIFATEEDANSFIEVGKPWDKQRIEVNVGYPEPMLAPKKSE